MNKKIVPLSLGILLIAVVAFTIFSLKDGTFLKGSLSNVSQIPSPTNQATQVQENYALPGVWYGDGALSFRVQIPPGFVAERVIGEDANDDRNELDVRTTNDFDTSVQGPEQGAWRPALTFEIHTYAPGEKTTPLQWAKANFADVPNNAQSISIDGRPGIKYVQNLNPGKLTVYVFNQSKGNNPVEKGIIAILATESINNAQLNAVIQSIKFTF